jgi:hypothetical protein
MPVTGIPFIIFPVWLDLAAILQLQQLVRP